MNHIDLVHQAFIDTFPIRAANASLEFVELGERKDSTELGVVVRLIVWDVNADTGVRSIRDVKEQEVYLKVPGLDIASVARLREMLGALAVVAAKALAHPKVECLMPHDLLDFSPLKLVKAQTEADFVAALSVPSRLGRYLSVNP